MYLFKTASDLQFFINSLFIVFKLVHFAKVTKVVMTHLYIISVNTILIEAEIRLNSSGLL